MTSAATPPRLDGDQRSTIARKLGRFLGSTTRPHALLNTEHSHHTSSLDSPSPSSPTSPQRIPPFRHTKSISMSSATSTFTSSDAPSPSIMTGQSSTPLTKTFESPSTSSSFKSRSSRAPSRASTSISKSKHSRPPSPPSMYASFAWEGPIKKPTRPLVLDPKKQRARAKGKAKSSDKCLPLVTEISPLSSPASSAALSACPSAASSTPSAIAKKAKAFTVETSSPTDAEFKIIESPVDSIQSKWHDELGYNGQPTNSNPSGAVMGKSQDMTTQSLPSTDSVSETAETPRMPVLSESELRQRKMEKINRTLGENVPPELVFGDGNAKERGRSKDDSEIADTLSVERHTPAKQAHVALLTKRASLQLSGHISDRESTSTPSPITNQPPNVTMDEGPVDPPTEPPPQLVISVSCSEKYDRVKGISDEGQWLTGKPKLPTLPESLLSKSASTSSGSHSQPITITEEIGTSPVIHHSRGKSEQTPIADALPRSHMIARSSSLLVHPKMSERSFPSPHSLAPFAPYLESTKLLSSPAPSIPKSSGSGVQRKERYEGWSGEWNQNDMQDVIRKLRNLK